MPSKLDAEPRAKPTEKRLTGVKQSTGATPLFALEAVAVDTETTGLDPLTARVVQLAAIHLSGQRMLDAPAVDSIVNPGVPIPPRSTAIHGIDDATVANVRELDAVWPAWRKATEGRVWIGHSVGFDIAVLQREASRRLLEFAAPRFLDTRLLASIAVPRLADNSLDALASWLDIEIVDRHSAAGDARAAAAIFVGLIPLLQSCGVRTLAEAERACMRFGSEIRMQEDAGWSVARPGAQTGGASLSRIDTYAYRRTVATVMSSPVAVMSPDTPLGKALDSMTAQGISSVFVAKPPQAGLPATSYAILTERDVTRRISAIGGKALRETIGGLAKAPLRTIRANAFVYRAIGRMNRLKFRHLGVTDDEGRLTGIVSARDLLRSRIGPAVALDDSIEAATNSKDLAVAWSSLPQVVNSLIGEDVEGWQVCLIVSEEIRAMTRRAAELALAAMRDGGMGDPPCPFSVMVLGSAGRGESLLVPDQDNAIVYRDGEPGSPGDLWFRDFATRMSDILDGAGIPLCKGGVMAKNDQWRGSAALWRQRVEAWVTKSRLQDLLNVDIFFDEIGVFGEAGLANELFEEAYRLGHSGIGFAKMLGENLPDPPRPFTLFGRLKGPGNSLDLKLHALFPIAAAARALAIRHNLALRSTRERLQGLIAKKIGGETDLVNLADAHARALAIVLEAQAASIVAGRKASNEIDLSTLSSRRREELRDVLRKVEILPTLVRGLMFG